VWEQYELEDINKKSSLKKNEEELK